LVKLVDIQEAPNFVSTFRRNLEREILHVGEAIIDEDELVEEELVEIVLVVDIIDEELPEVEEEADEILETAQPG
jgi:hypothetical protein